MYVLRHGGPLVGLLMKPLGPPPTGPTAAAADSQVPDLPAHTTVSECLHCDTSTGTRGSATSGLLSFIHQLLVSCDFTG